MVDYVVKHQNNYVYSNLFTHNFVDMMNKGIVLCGLLNSKILQF